MDHVAILRRSQLKKDDNLLKQILSGNKTIESRWYVNRVSPWNKIKKGETVYFKESGHPVIAKAQARGVLQFENLNNALANKIIKKYGKKIAPDLSDREFVKWWFQHNNKRYCILIFLQNPQLISPFNIDKTGFGAPSAWLVTDNINKIKKT